MHHFCNAFRNLQLHSLITDLMYNLKYKNKLVLLCLYFLYRYIPKGFTISSERKMRKQQDIFIKDNLCGEMIKLVFPSTKADGINGFETKETPFVYINNLPSLILDYLDRLDRYMYL